MGTETGAMNGAHRANALPFSSTLSLQTALLPEGVGKYRKQAQSGLAWRRQPTYAMLPNVDVFYVQKCANRMFTTSVYFSRLETKNIAKGVYGGLNEITIEGHTPPPGEGQGE